MKPLFSAALCLILLSTAVFSSSIEVGVREVLKGSVLSITYDNSASTVRFSTEFYNTGSVGYSARLRLRVVQESAIVFEGWSQKKDMGPGDKQNFVIFWNNNASGNYTADIRAYYGNEIADYKDFDFSVKGTNSQDAFEMTGMRTYDDHIMLDITGKSNASVVIIPTDYTNGWIFEQAKLDIAENQSRTVMIRYVPTLWSPSTVKIVAASTDGKLYSEKTFGMEKDSSLVGMINSLIDSVKLYFSA